jgi:Uma2 family endonuclease
LTRRRSRDAHSTALDTQLEGRCAVMSSDQRVVAANRERYVYPDLSVVCDPARPELGAGDVLVNPTILIEVLSTTTEQYDRGLTWEGYQRIESLTDYVLISQAGISSPVPASASSCRTTRCSTST